MLLTAGIPINSLVSKIAWLEWKVSRCTWLTIRTFFRLRLLIVSAVIRFLFYKNARVYTQMFFFGSTSNVFYHIETRRVARNFDKGGKQ